MKEKLLKDIIYYLKKENNYNVLIPNSYNELKKLYKTLVNIRMPKDISEEILKKEDEYLKLELMGKRVVDVNNLKEIEENIILYKGDITTLKCDVIVNAGNSDGLGCFNPSHKCVDNIVHTNAGMRLRMQCNEILKGKKLKNGEILVCDAYNLPCKKVITTVGPMIDGFVTKKDEIDLENCYKNALKYAILNNYKSIAFPSISTGLFSFPIKKAKKIAYKSVKAVLSKYNTNIKVIFDVYSKEDYDEYREIFKS